MADEEPADDTDDLALSLPALPSDRFLQDDDELFPVDENDASPPASPPGQKQRGRLRIHNVGGSLTLLLQVRSAARLFNSAGYPWSLVSP